MNKEFKQIADEMMLSMQKERKRIRRQRDMLLFGVILIFNIIFALLYTVDQLSALLVAFDLVISLAIFYFLKDWQDNKLYKVTQKFLINKMRTINNERNNTQDD